MKTPTLTSSRALQNSLDQWAPRGSYHKRWPHIFPSEEAFRWFYRRHRKRLASAGALMVIGGRAYVNVPAVDALVVELGIQAAQISSERAQQPKATRRGCPIHQSHPTHLTAVNSSGDDARRSDVKSQSVEPARSDYEKDGKDFRPMISLTDRRRHSVKHRRTPQHGSHGPLQLTLEIPEPESCPSESTLSVPDTVSTKPEGNQR